MSRRGSILQDYGNINHNQTMEAQHAAANYYQRDKEQSNEFAYRDKKEKQREQGDATDFIGKLKVDHVGDNTVDLYNDAEIAKLQNELIGMQNKGASVQDIKITAMQKLPKIAQGYTIAKNGYDKITNGLKDLTKDYPSGNMEAARSTAAKDFLKDIFEYDDKGNVLGYKDPSIIPQNKDYVASLTDEDKLEQWYQPSGGLVKNIQGLPMTKIGESKKVRDKRGKEFDNAWEGQGSVFSQLKTDPETGATIGQEIKFEKEPIGKNSDGTIQYANVMPKDEFALMTQTPTAKADFTIQFNKHLKDMGVDGKTLDPRAKDILQRQYAKDWLDQTNLDGSSFITKQVEKQPLPPRISVKVNTGGSETPVINVFKTIKEKLADHTEEKTKAVQIGGKMVKGVLQTNLLDDNEQSVVLDKANKASPEFKLGIDDVYIKEFKDGIWIMRVEDNVPLTKLTETGTNVSANQPLGMASKKEAVNKAQGKTFEVIDPTTGKVVMSGVDKAAADKAKSKGYKIK